MARRLAPHSDLLDRCERRKEHIQRRTRSGREQEREGEAKARTARRWEVASLSEFSSESKWKREKEGEYERPSERREKKENEERDRTSSIIRRREIFVDFDQINSRVTSPYRFPYRRITHFSFVSLSRSRDVAVRQRPFSVSWLKLTRARSIPICCISDGNQNVRL